MYGALQLAFTAAALAAFLPTYFSYPLALGYQLAKVWLPILHGGRHTCEKMPSRLLRQALGFQGSGGGLKLPAHSHVQLLRAGSLSRGGRLARAGGAQRTASAGSEGRGGGGGGQGGGGQGGGGGGNDRVGWDAAAAALQHRPARGKAGAATGSAAANGAAH
jgi:uncharacterized membrane protein YgcG